MYAPIEQYANDNWTRVQGEAVTFECVGGIIRANFLFSIKWLTVRTTDLVGGIRHSAPYVNAHRGKTFVVMLGGEAIQHPNFRNILNDIAFSDQQPDSNPAFPEKYVWKTSLLYIGNQPDEKCTTCVEGQYRGEAE